MAYIENRKKETSLLRHILYSVSFVILLLLCSILQCSGIKLFGVSPDITFGVICAIGFIAKEKYGGIFGLCGGVLIMSLGTSGISLALILFTFCGYLCGVLPKIVLRRNFYSYLIFAPLMSAIHVFFTFIYYIMISKSSLIWKAFGRLIIPEFLSCIICIIPAYFAVLSVYTLFKGKNNRTGRL